MNGSLGALVGLTLALPGVAATLPPAARAQTPSVPPFPSVPTTPASPSSPAGIDPPAAEPPFPDPTAPAGAYDPLAAPPPEPLVPTESEVPQAPPLELELSANRQSYDSQRGRFVATGNVMARVAGGRLLADRIEFEDRSRTIYAFGSVRFQRGLQYLQASRLRFSLIEGSGELNDVYGVLDLDGSATDFDLESTPSVPLPPPEPISCPPAVPPPPEWHPHPWAVTAWGGQMFDADFGQTFIFQGQFRPEYLAGLGVQRRLLQAGPFALELDVNWLNHWAAATNGIVYDSGNIPAREQEQISTDPQYFSEFTAGLMLRAWLRPWLSIGFEEGISVLTGLSEYESNYRRKSSRLLNYLAFEVEALVSPQWSAVGRIHHRSGAFGTFNGVSEGSNAYLLGLRYRYGQSPTALDPIVLPPAQGCPGAPPPGNEPPEGLAEQLEQVTFGPGTTAAGAPPPPPPEAELPASGGDAWSLARQRERERREAIAGIDQRIEKVKFQQSLTAERRYGFPTDFDRPDDSNVFGQIRPSQLRDLTTKDNRQLVQGTISRWRFQARRLVLTANTLEGDRVAFTNDPFTPAQSWIDSEDVVATLMPNGDTVIKAGRNQLRLEDRLPIPVTRETRIQKQEEVDNQWVLGFDEEDRDGFFVGYNIPLRLGERARLVLQPQFMVERAFDGNTSSYPPPGEPVGSSTAEQSLTAGDLFGLKAQLTTPLAGFDAEANLDLTTFNPDNFADGTRSWGDLSRPVRLPLLGDSRLSLFGAYRYRVWNGSLGNQDIYSAYGVTLEDRGVLPDWGNLSSNYFWRAGVGNYVASPSDNEDLTQVWRGSAIGSLNLSLQIWRGESAALTPDQAYANTARPIEPGLRLNANLLGTVAYFDDGSNQNTITLSGGPTLTLGQFVRPFLDYTELTITGGGTLRQGVSPLSFDRAVDLGTLGIGLTQQLIGPVVFNGGIGLNVDPGSEFYGDVTNSYVELRWQRRAYEVGIFYSPYEGLGGVRVRLNDFNFDGTGVPFVPYHPSQGQLRRPF